MVTLEASAPPDRDAVGAREQLRWFGTLWVMAAVFHYTDSQPESLLPVLVAGLPALLFPTSPWAFGLFVAASAVNATLVLPTAANHTVLSLLVAGAFAGAALWVLLAVRERQRGSFPARWLETARTPVGLTLLVVYGFTVFDKLNTAFFDPATSCAGALLTQLIGLNTRHAVSLDPVVVQTAAIGTVAVEAAILVLLAVPRWRCWGLLVGVAFHAMLALASFYDFATTVFALYVLLVPPRVLAGMAARATVPRRVALAAFATHVVMSAGIGVAGGDVSPYGLTWHTLQVLTWYVAVLPLMVPLVRAAVADRLGRSCRSPRLPGSSDPVGWPGWRWRPAVLLVVPLLAAVNGATPYLGLKTVANYSMFSNLDTEQGSTNHLLPGVLAAQLVDYQRETVTVNRVEMPAAEIATADRGGVAGAKLPVRWARWVKEKPPVTIPWLELRRVTQLWRDAGLTDVRVEYLRDGVPQVAIDATTDPELGTPMPWWQRRLLAFRATDSGLGPDVCRW